MNPSLRRSIVLSSCAAGLCVAVGAGIFFWPQASPTSPLAAVPRAAASVKVAPAARPDARSIALAPHEGSDTIDLQISAAQKRAATHDEPRAFEQLGWLFVQKARLSNDPGFYKLAEQCGLAIEEIAPGQPDGLLLRGHALESMHHFGEAEALARQLVAQREYVLDFALLGDALMEQGRLDAAIDAYQKMADLKPCLQVYTRIAHMRWLRGDLEGALEMAEEAAHCGNSRDPEPLVWALTKLGGYRLENGELPQARSAAGQALNLLPHHAGALLLRGRILLAQDRAADAIASLEEAARLNPLPEPQWTLAEALRTAGREQEAAATEDLLARNGAVEDPRSFAVYLATHGERSADALQLAQRELAQRQDVFTYDALAWADLAAGKDDEARAASVKARAEGTRDPRLLMHSAIIAARTGAADAPALLEAAHATQQALLPSEREALDRARTVALSQSVTTDNAAPKTQ